MPHTLTPSVIIVLDPPYLQFILVFMVFMNWLAWFQKNLHETMCEYRKPMTDFLLED